jgi:hypothetical protein
VPLIAGFGRFNGQFVFVGGTPVLSYSPLDWSVFQPKGDPRPGPPNQPSCNNCFGLALAGAGDVPEQSVLDPSAGMIRFVPTPPAARFVLAWARTCLGMYNTVCSFSLMRVAIPDGTARVVAVASEALPAAVSVDGKHLAFAAADGIYVKDLP